MSPGAASPVFGTSANTLKLDFQVDHTIYAGLAVDEARQVYLVSGGTPAGVGPLAAGESVAVRIDGLGELVNPVLGAD